MNLTSFLLLPTPQSRKVRLKLTLAPGESRYEHGLCMDCSVEARKRLSVYSVLDTACFHDEAPWMEEMEPSTDSVLADERIGKCLCSTSHPSSKAEGRASTEHDVRTNFHSSCHAHPNTRPFHPCRNPWCYYSLSEDTLRSESGRHRIIRLRWLRSTAAAGPHAQRCTEVRLLAK